jgi:hypothetical protein
MLGDVIMQSGGNFMPKSQRMPISINKSINSYKSDSFLIFRPRQITPKLDSQLSI